MAFEVLSVAGPGAEDQDVLSLVTLGQKGRVSRVERKPAVLAVALAVSVHRKPGEHWDSPLLLGLLVHPLRFTQGVYVRDQSG